MMSVINAKIFFILILFLLETSVFNCQKAKFKNILFIVADDLGWSDIGYGDSQIHSPNIDKLAKSGIIFNHSYAYPLCTPSRNSFLSGVYAEHTGLQHHVILPQDPIGLPDSFVLLPDMMKSFGYSTSAIGKWHLGFCNKKYTPCDRGFDSFYGYFNAEGDYYSHRVPALGHEPVTIDGFDFWNQTTEYLEPILDQNNTYSMFTYTKRAIEIFKEQDKSKPFFMYFASQNVHDPIQVPASYEAFYKDVHDENRRKTLAMVSVLDEAVGNLTQTLDDLGLLDDTLIFFTSDNGGATYVSGRNYPLRGGKMTVFEGGTRVRGFVNGRNLKPNVYDGMFHAVDWMPTILHAAIGLPVEITGIDGVDQWSSILDNLESKRDTFIYNIDPFGIKGCDSVPTQAIRHKDFKLIRGCPGPYTDWYPIPKYDRPLFLKTEVYRNSTKINLELYLYNLIDDPFEKTNLADEYPDLVKLLSKKLDDFMKTTVPPLQTPSLKPSPESDPKYWGDKWSPGWC